MKKIPVVISSDEKNFFALGVVLTSLMKNAAADTFYEINVLHTSDVTQDNKDKLYQLQEKYHNSSITMFDMKDRFSDISVTEGYHVNYVSAYKMLVASLLPHYNKVIYLDTDILVRADLREMYDFDMGECYLAGTPVLNNSIYRRSELTKTLGIPSMDYYINAGVMLMNLQKIREDKVDEQWIKLLGSFEGSVDQHILNKVCYGKTCYFPPKYNVCMSERGFFKSEEIFAYSTPKDVKEAFDNPVIFHWAGIYKPWKYDDTFLAQEWLYYFNISPFKKILVRDHCGVLKSAKASAVVTAVKKPAKALLIKTKYYICGLPLFKVKEKTNGTKGFLLGFIPVYRKKYYCKKAKMKNFVWQNDGKKIKLFIFGVKVFSMKKRNKYERIYAKRFSGLTFKELQYCIKEQFKRRFGKYPNLKNPQTFQEKLAWEKLYYKNPLMTICADKVKARDYFCRKVKDGEQYLVKQIGVYDAVDEIDFAKLPKRYVLKSNWGSGKQFVVKDSALFDIEKAKKAMQKWQQKEANHYFKAFETGYKDIEPKIVCEEFLDFEYKLEFFCFNGEPKFFWIVLDDKTSDTTANFYTLDWQKMPISNHYPNFDKKITKPICFEQILDDAKKMCGDFPFVRCDFYVTEDGYRFSEMTFFHWAGLQHFEPLEYDKIIGDMMQLPL